MHGGGGAGTVTPAAVVDFLMKYRVELGPDEEKKLLLHLDRTDSGKVPAADVARLVSQALDLRTCPRICPSFTHLTRARGVGGRPAWTPPPPPTSSSHAVYHPSDALPSHTPTPRSGLPCGVPCSARREGARVLL